MRFHPALAPFKACILPLSKKLSEQAGELYAELSKHFLVDYDEAGSIGKRYRRQDEIGTPFCITYDFDSVEDGCVTVRDRDTMPCAGWYCFYPSDWRSVQEYSWVSLQSIKQTLMPVPFKLPGSNPSLSLQLAKSGLDATAAAEADQNQIGSDESL